MKMISFICFATILCAAGQVLSQDLRAMNRNGAYLEAYLIRPGHSDGPISVNYERLFGRRAGTSLRIGILPDFENSFGFPFTASKLINPMGRHQGEVGLGLVYRLEIFRGRTYHYLVALMLPLMYRYQSDSGFFLRGGLNTFVSWPSTLSPSISAGYRF